jgi:hypothetical protein
VAQVFEPGRAERGVLDRVGTGVRRARVLHGVHRPRWQPDPGWIRPGGPVLRPYTRAGDIRVRSICVAADGLTSLACHSLCGCHTELRPPGRRDADRRRRYSHGARHQLDLRVELDEAIHRAACAVPRGQGGSEGGQGRSNQYRAGEECRWRTLHDGLSEWIKSKSKTARLCLPAMAFVIVVGSDGGREIGLVNHTIRAV